MKTTQLCGDYINTVIYIISLYISWNSREPRQKKKNIPGFIRVFFVLFFFRGFKDTKSSKVVGMVSKSQKRGFVVNVNVSILQDLQKLWFLQPDLREGRSDFSGFLWWGCKRGRTLGKHGKTIRNMKDPSIILRHPHFGLVGSSIRWVKIPNKSWTYCKVQIKKRYTSEDEHGTSGTWSWRFGRWFSMFNWNPNWFVGYPIIPKLKRKIMEKVPFQIRR